MQKLNRRRRRKRKVTALDELVKNLMRQALAPSMQMANISHFQNFRRFCTTLDKICLPATPLIIMQYLASLAPTTVVTSLLCHFAAIHLRHVVKGREDPTKDVHVDYHLYKVKINLPRRKIDLYACREFRHILVWEIPKLLR